MDFSYLPWTFRTVRTTDFSYHPRTFRTVARILVSSTTDSDAGDDDADDADTAAGDDDDDANDANNNIYVAVSMSPFGFLILFLTPFSFVAVELLRQYDKSEDGAKSPWYERYEKS